MRGIAIVGFPNLCHKKSSICSYSICCFLMITLFFFFNKMSHIQLHAMSQTVMSIYRGAGSNTSNMERK